MFLFFLLSLINTADWAIRHWICG